MIRISKNPGDFMVRCTDCGATSSFLDWEHVTYCAVSGEGARICSACGGERPVILPSPEEVDARCEALGHYAQVIVAVDHSVENLSITSVLERLGDAVIDLIVDITPHYRTGVPLPRFRVIFDASQVRNTEANGYAYRAGFVSHIMQWKDLT